MFYFQKTLISTNEQNAKTFPAANNQIYKNRGKNIQEFKLKTNNPFSVKRVFSQFQTNLLGDNKSNTCISTFSYL